MDWVYEGKVGFMRYGDMNRRLWAALRSSNDMGRRACLDGLYRDVLHMMSFENAW